LGSGCACLRQSFLKAVVHMPNFFATSDSGKWKWSRRTFSFNLSNCQCAHASAILQISNREQTHTDTCARMRTSSSSTHTLHASPASFLTTSPACIAAKNADSPLYPHTPPAPSAPGPPHRVGIDWQPHNGMPVRLVGANTHIPQPVNSPRMPHLHAPREGMHSPQLLCPGPLRLRPMWLGALRSSAWAADRLDGFQVT